MLVGGEFGSHALQANPRAPARLLDLRSKDLGPVPLTGIEPKERLGHRVRVVRVDRDGAGALRSRLCLGRGSRARGRSRRVRPGLPGPADPSYGIRPISPPPSGDSLALAGGLGWLGDLVSGGVGGAVPKGLCLPSPRGREEGPHGTTRSSSRDERAGARSPTATP
jgi:hypothetical protein